MKITTKHPMADQLVADVALVGRFVKEHQPEREAMIRIFAHVLVQDATLREAIDQWPQFDTDIHAEISGGDIVEWFAQWRDTAKLALAATGLPELLRQCSDAALVIEQALKRVEIANGEGDPILSAWREDAQATLAKLRGIAEWGGT